MIKGIESVLLFSENPKELMEFYRDTLGLKVDMEGEYGDEEELYVGFQPGKGSYMVVMHHSKVKGKNREPERFMVNFEVDNIEKEVARLDKAKVRKIQDIYHVEDYGKIATFVDPDGNYFQLVQIRPSPAKAN
ncbi:MAG: hypothetical protein UV73_C0008G0008 [Candidatus Gottesmanbacteria bacterium GW2011_GWA2_43_14]|uniref:VOC domain-containing protein n=1 Tax=Candidatus Gottesmanbacteria bacterium GW2011_GWA2_43_14 TaxID=1618443 RepID=A0A0G1GF42_9BACT|nr:MAG: hypothetical protein UV73_C0008G0008 [Candidatus Gottesmanbacteria bacterium GW2011_GWA2_43_14]